MLKTFNKIMKAYDAKNYTLVKKLMSLAGTQRRSFVILELRETGRDKIGSHIVNIWRNKVEDETC